MPDNVAITAGSGTTVATDEVDGRHFQRIKLALGVDGVYDGDASSNNPLPSKIDRTDNLLVMLSRVVKLLESNAVVDQQQRQRVNVDAFVATIPTVTTVSTVASVTNVAAQTGLAGMDREMYINIAKQTYAQSIRSRLTIA